MLGALGSGPQRALGPVYGVLAVVAGLGDCLAGGGEQFGVGLLDGGKSHGRFKVVDSLDGDGLAGRDADHVFGRLLGDACGGGHLGRAGAQFLHLEERGCLLGEAEAFAVAGGGDHVGVLVGRADLVVLDGHV